MRLRPLILAAALPLLGLLCPTQGAPVGEARTARIRTASIGVGESREVIDLTSLAGFGTAPRAFRACFENEDATAGDTILVDVLASSSALAAPPSELTTPADATLSTVDVVGISTTRATAHCNVYFGLGLVWQSTVNAVVAGVSLIFW